MNVLEELEIKFKADGVDFKQFNEVMLRTHSAKRIHAACPDVYYKRGLSVVRHRLSEGAGELTLKKRKSDDSIKDRLEIDLKFDKSINKVAVETFLLESDYEVVFILDKDSYIYHVTRPETGIESVLAYYTVGIEGFDTRAFIEVEIEKSNTINKKEALKELTWWKHELQLRIGVGEPLNESLYEVFSGKKYAKKST